MSVIFDWVAVILLFIIGGKEVSLPSPINRAIQKKGEGCAG